MSFHILFWFSSFLINFYAIGMYQGLFESFEEMKALLSGNDGEPSIPSNDYQNIRTFSVEYQADFNGKLEKVINQ